MWPKEAADVASPMVAYKWMRVPFGLSCSPFLLRVTVNKPLLSAQNKFPETVEQLLEQLYVDDYLGGTNKIEETKRRVDETTEIFQEAQLNMRSWATNDKELSSHLQEKGLKNKIEGLLSPVIDGQQKVLGIRWSTGLYIFHFKPATIVEAAEEIGDAITKRKLLSISARVFDPIGSPAPTILIFKLIYQRLWEKDIDWDQLAPDEEKKEWKTAIGSLKSANSTLGRIQ